MNAVMARGVVARPATGVAWVVTVEAELVEPVAVVVHRQKGNKLIGPEDADQSISGRFFLHRPEISLHSVAVEG